MIHNGAVPGLGSGLWVLCPLRSENPPFFGDGDHPFSTTTLAAIAKAVVGVLQDLDET